MSPRLVLATALLAAAAAAHAQRPAPPEGPMTAGYLCCNVRSYGKTISDINYDEGGMQTLTVGTPARITGYERVFFRLEVDGRPQRFNNDYSRDLGSIAFAQRWVVTEDPKLKIATYEPAVREAILAGRVLPGMTREQVLMAIGWPVTSENPASEKGVWRYWLSASKEFQVLFDAQGKVSKVIGEPLALHRVSAP